MGMLKKAFNAILKIHSRNAHLKRFGTPDLISKIRITPSNYFRNLEGPSHIIIRGREFVIPIDSILGTARQTITFSSLPTTGSFKLTYGTTDTTAFDETATSSTIQTALRLITGLSAVTVTGNFTSGFTVVFYSVSDASLLVATKILGDELDVTTITVARITGLQFPEKPIKRGDKIIDPVFGSLAIDEVYEMPDLGGGIIGYRCRCE